jgi:hypothetical protein
MLESRTIAATLSGETLGASTSRGCPQGGMLVDDLLWGLNDDDIAILINRKFLSTVSKGLHAALYTVQQWRERRSLSIILNKTVIIPITRKRNVKGP